MGPLDLSSKPPRGPREEMLGLSFIPRTIDKIRGHLPGGNPGRYIVKQRGMTSYVLKQIKVDPDELIDAVAQARTEADVEHWLREHADLNNVDDLNRRISNVTIGMQDEATLAQMRTFYAGIDAVPKDTKIFDLLERDDAQLLSS